MEVCLVRGGASESRKSRQGHHAAWPEYLEKLGAEKALFLIDMEAYLEQLKPVLKTAKRSIWIIGWDLNPDFDLDQ